MGHFTDLHWHVLPGIDDGAKTAEESLALLRLLKAAGFDCICATPHQKAAQFLPSAAEIQSAYAVSHKLASEMGDLTLLLGAENYWDDVFFDRARERQIPCYTGGKAFLVEIPTTQTPPRFEEHLFQQRAR